MALLANDLRARGVTSKYSTTITLAGRPARIIDVTQSKCWTTTKGVQRQGKLIDKGYLYKMLKNPVYIGISIAAHKGKHYPGEHEAIVARALWDKVQSSLKEGVTRRKGQLAPRPSKAPTLLRGLVFGEDGRAFTPTYTSKGNRYYRYYVNTAAIKIGTHNCDVARVPAGEIEAVVVEQLRHVLQSPEVLAHTVREVVTLRPEITVSTEVPMRFRRRGGQAIIVLPDGARAVARKEAKVDNTMVKLMARGFRWQRLLENGAYATIEDLAAAEKINASYVSRILRLAFLAPDIVEAILDGKHPPSLTAKRLKEPFPTDWLEQKRHFYDP